MKAFRHPLCACGIHSFVEPLWYWTPELVCRRCYCTKMKPDDEIARHSPPPAQPQKSAVILYLVPRTVSALKRPTSTETNVNEQGT